MLSNQVLQNNIEGLAYITKKDIFVFEHDGKVAAVTNDSVDYSDISRHIRNFAESPAESQIVQGWQFFKVYNNEIVEYIILVTGDDDESFRVGKIAVFTVQNLTIAYKERFDKDNFIKNLLLDNLLPIDVYNRAKKLKIDTDALRVVYLIETDDLSAEDQTQSKVKFRSHSRENDLNPMEILRGMFPSKGKDFVAEVDEQYMIVVRELKSTADETAIEREAMEIRDTLCAETMNRVCVSIGTPVTGIKEISYSYKEAKIASAVGKLFDREQTIFNYKKLGIGRIIYQLPVSLCKIFLDEVLRGATVAQFDDDLLTTIAMFFEYNLNVSETARQLFIHRNTLVYRLDKIEKMTGLDLRVFDDAITFKIMMMVSRYVEYIAKTV